MINQAFLGLGSNLGDRRANILRAIDEIGNIAVRIETSSFYETTPRGFSTQPRFINTACMIWTRLSAFQLMDRLARIEALMGRKRTFVNAPRLIDIDILFYGKSVVATKVLTVPHPRMCAREFVLAPLMEIAPAVIHPTALKSVKQLWNALPPQTKSAVRIAY